MIPLPSWGETPALSRRHGLVCLGLALAVGPALAQRPGAVLPAAQSLPDELARALRQQQPLLVLVSQDGCVSCRQVRQSHLWPMHQAGRVVVQVDMRSAQPVLDFSGKLTTHDQLSRAWKVSVTPTLLFWGRGGVEVAERMAGALLPDFYGAYLDDRIAQARKAL